MRVQMDATLMLEAAAARFYVAEERIFSSLFGVSPLQAEKVWQYIVTVRWEHRLERIHLLLTLHFYKVYPTHDQGAGYFYCSRATHIFYVTFVTDCINLTLPTVSTAPIST